ncbi:MAG: cryptochrome/photolyase family protein [Candidatus Nanopelagicales bacterium]|nr:cryptochrome/photolyase family protein [Candidatus Nanopelagicales bacterium]MCF8539323.1 cryptochrome/photolyase family protein [Candidatus Nanopelagicales bacterium]MCF8550932.1 cryptochrome/photolyase family protein [Candidatus Nanopelagicales bacterium]
MTEPTSAVLVTFDQLSLTHGALATADPTRDDVVFIESASMLNGRTWHAQRIFFLLSSVAHVMAELRDRGFTVVYLPAATMADGVAEFRHRHPNVPLRSTAPTSHALHEIFVSLGIELVPNDLFLTSREEFAEWASGYKSLTMEYFYRWQRKRLNILMDGAQPVGGQWNFDADNRLPPPRTKKGQPAHVWPTPPHHEFDQIDTQIMERLNAFTTWGDPPTGTWATTREGALRTLDHFVTESLADFGPYEDAMPTDTWTVNHSLLSPYLNVGLLHPQEVVDAAIARYNAGGIPLPSIEGFVRQVIGWREYINGVYWYVEPEYRSSNSRGAESALLPLFSDPTATKMHCMSSVVRDVEQRAWTHHIPRLMLLANLALLTDCEPQQIFHWMRTSFIDAADWVMVPNVIGMGVHADGGRMMTKPYAAGGAYISRMSNYCGSCVYDPKKRTGEDACPFTTLYWDFLDRHRKEFTSNHRMGQQLRGLDRLSDLPEVRERAQQVMTGLEQGEI